MTYLFSQLRAALFGNRDASLSIPIMDGAFKPNNLLENAPVFAERAGLEDLALGADGTLYAAAGDGVFRVSDDGAFAELRRFDRAVTALAIAADGSIAVGLGNRVEVHAASTLHKVIDGADGRPLMAANALHFGPDGALLISDGSAARAYDQWSRDLMEKGRSGRLLRHDPASERTETLASGLEYAFGAFVDERGRPLVSESWRHQIRAIDHKRAVPALVNLPGYPARLAAAEGGGFWLTLFACRTQLIEFVLCETHYRKEMMRTVDPRYWVAPALSSGDDFLEPLQGGGVKQMGILKPWAPPRSYGLVVRVGADFLPKYALHSRVGGAHHGVVAVAQRGDDLFVLSKGAGRILRLSVSDASKGLIA